MSNKIEIKPCQVASEFSKDSKDMTAWLQNKTSKLNSSNIFLLSFHDDGVVWGKIDDSGNLRTSDELKDDKGNPFPSPEFRPQTLQELRLFGENGQIHVWRIGETEFKASLALDGDSGEYEFLQTEEQVLHGTKTKNDNDVNREFTIVADGSEGLRHAFPQKVSFKGEKRPLRLHVKHYIEYDDDGCARIAFSRLVNIGVE